MKALRPFEMIYHTVVGAKNRLYDTGVLTGEKLPVPVISIGNLSFGGTGKTPCILFLAKELGEEFKFNVVTRSYRADLTRPERVNLNRTGAAAVYGDEACLLQAHLPHAEVWSGPVKTDTARASLASSPDLILVDDGFSHRRLVRDFDLVLIDATAGLDDDYLREPIGSLGRASAVLLTKVNLAGPEAARSLCDRLQVRFPRLPVFEATVSSVVPAPKKSGLFLFCGLGRPDSLVRDLELQGFTIHEKILFHDHYAYTAADETRILELYRAARKQRPNLVLLTTGKDMVKLQNPELRTCAAVPVHFLDMTGPQREALIAEIRKSF